MPRSDRLLQEIHADDPWRILAVCILLNQTGRVLVDRVVDLMFARWPDAYAMADAPLRPLAGLLAETGLGWVKAARLIHMSADYIVWYETGRMLLEQVHGVGQYAIDSYEIFHLGRTDHPVPSRDKELMAYVGRGPHPMGHTQQFTDKNGTHVTGCP